jgi:hypothetical protein
MEDVGIFYGFLVLFAAVWYILWSLGIVYGSLGYVLPFWYVLPRKIWQPVGNAPNRNHNKLIKP